RQANCEQQPQPGRLIHAVRPGGGDGRIFVAGRAPGSASRAAIVVGSLLVSGPAMAREAFSKGTLALGAERLSVAFHVETSERNTSADTFALLGAGDDATTAASVFQFPRFAFDGFVADGVSLGSSMIAFSRGRKQRDTYDRSTETAFIVGPRVGF